MRFAGTGVFYSQFVNTKTGDISDIYHTPFADSEVYVAIMNRADSQIEVYDIFSGEMINSYKRDFDNQMAGLTISGEFSEDNKILTVTYLDVDKNEVTEDFKIRQ
jgi:hypothetical protein